MSHLCLEVTFLDHFCEHELVDHFFFGTHIFGSFFLHKLVDQYGALYLHYVLLLLPVGSFFLMTNWWIACPGNHGSFCLAVGGGFMG